MGRSVNATLFYGISLDRNRLEGDRWDNFFERLENATHDGIDELMLEARGCPSRPPNPYADEIGAYEEYKQWDADHQEECDAYDSARDELTKQMPKTGIHGWMESGEEVWYVYIKQYVSDDDMIITADMMDLLELGIDEPLMEFCTRLDVPQIKPEWHLVPYYG